MVAYFSRKCRNVIISTNEAEIYACSECFKELIYYNELICNLMHGRENDGVKCSKCDVPILMVNNIGVMLFVKNGFSRKNRFIEFRQLAIKDYVERKEFQLEQVKSKLNCADIFTKDMDFNSLDANRKSIGLIEYQK